MEVDVPQGLCDSWGLGGRRPFTADFNKCNLQPLRSHCRVEIAYNLQSSGKSSGAFFVLTKETFSSPYAWWHSGSFLWKWETGLFALDTPAEGHGAGGRQTSESENWKRR